MSEILWEWTKSRLHDKFALTALGLFSSIASIMFFIIVSKFQLPYVTIIILLDILITVIALLI